MTKPLPKTVSNNTAKSFMACLNTAAYCAPPYGHWLLEDVLPIAVAEAISGLPFPPPTNLDFNGKRETNNSSRIYFTKENQARFPVCQEVVDAFDSPEIRGTIEEKTGVDLSEGLLRVEYCQDIDGFWLEPHTDISVKKFTMLVYLSDAPELFDVGTDIYEGPPDFKHVKSAPYQMNKGLVFIPGKNTWHGLTKRKIAGVRKSIIINYVYSEWRDKWELA